MDTRAADAVSRMTTAEKIANLDTGGAPIPVGATYCSSSVWCVCVCGCMDVGVVCVQVSLSHAG